MNKDIFEQLGIDLRFVLSGFFGSLLLIEKLARQRKWLQLILTIVNGVSAATFLGGFIGETLHVTSKYGYLAIGFFVGTSAIQIVNYFRVKYLGAEGGTKDVGGSK